MMLMTLAISGLSANNVCTIKTINCKNMTVNYGTINLNTGAKDHMGSYTPKHKIEYNDVYANVGNIAYDHWYVECNGRIAVTPVGGYLHHAYLTLYLPEMVVPDNDEENED